MAKLMYQLNGVRGREMKLYDTKCVIITKKTAGSLLSGNFTDGEKTIFLCDVVGVQFKESKGLIGYLQLETPSMQMNNAKDNMFSENTFTFEDGKYGVTNQLMRKVYSYVVDRIEELKYGTVPCINTSTTASVASEPEPVPQKVDTPPMKTENTFSEESWVCGKCKKKNLNTRTDCWSCGNPK